MRINCFRAARGNCSELDDDQARPVNVVKANPIRRIGSGASAVSQVSTRSNESISKLPPCPRLSDSKIESMMMPLPHEGRQSSCLRLSHPRVYGNIVSDMKASKGCRDWRNFAVFYDDDVDMSTTAEEAARKKAIEYRQMVQRLNRSFESEPSSDRSVSVDMIG